MKAAIAAGAFVFLCLFVVTTLPSPAAEAQARAYGFTAEQIWEGFKYAVERKLLFWSRTALTLGLLTCAVYAAWGRKLVDLYGRLVPGRGRWLWTVLLVGATCFLVELVINLAFGWMGLEVQRAWGMTRRPFLDWLGDFWKSQAVQAVIGTAVLLGFYVLVRLFPRWWWLPAAAGGSALSVGLALILPVLIDPLFNTFEPLQDPQLRERVLALTREAGVPVQDVLVVDASRQGSHTNAYFTGFGPTRRIVLFDTLIKSHPPAEIDTILAHEIGHWEHNHIVKGLALGSMGAFVGCFLLSLFLRWAVGRRPFLLSAPYDPAGLPAMLLLGLLAAWLTMPVENAVSRHFERQADMASLNLTRRPEVFMKAERRLVLDNIGNVAPSPASVWLFASHPPAIERIRMAEEWEKEHGKKAAP